MATRYFRFQSSFRGWVATIARSSFGRESEPYGQRALQVNTRPVQKLAVFEDRTSAPRRRALIVSEEVMARNVLDGDVEAVVPLWAKRVMGAHLVAGKATRGVLTGATHAWRGDRRCELRRARQAAD